VTQFSIKYRPQKFSEVVGQKVTKRILMNSILMNRVPKAILLSGLHGCGKTSIARIYAKALNCENLGVDGEPCASCASCVSIQAGSSPLVQEYDAASHSGVEDARAFGDIVKFLPGSGWRVIILDECHMLSKSAQASLLKMVEEPPERTTFLFVTTDPSRMDPTISSRCMRLTVQPLLPEEIAQNVKSVLSQEGLTFSEGFVSALSSCGVSSLRDIQQMLGQAVISGMDLSEESLTESLGLISPKVYKELAYLLNILDFKLFVTTLRKWHSAGVDLEKLFIEGVPRVLRDFRVCISGAYSDGITYYSGISNAALAKNLRLSVDQVRYLTRQWEIDMEFMQDTPFPLVIWEKFAVSVCCNE
jgi:DNA polymerase III subunit gamma/tau